MPSQVIPNTVTSYGEVFTIYEEDLPSEDIRIELRVDGVPQEVVPSQRYYSYEILSPRMIMHAVNFHELITMYIRRLVTLYAVSVEKAMKEIFRPHLVYSYRQVHRLYTLAEIQSDNPDEKHYQAKVVDTHDFEVEDEFLLRIPKEQLRRWDTWPQFSEFLDDTVRLIGQAYSMGGIGYLTGREERIALGGYL
jgi:hypothetical protein